MAFDIRPAIASQSDEILQHHMETCATHAVAFPSLFPNQGIRKTAEGFLAKIFPGTDPDAAASNIFVAMQGGQMAGYIILAASTGKNSQIAELVGMSVYDIWTAPQARRQGVARALLNHAAAHYRQIGYADMRGTVWGGNTASQALFTACGFQETYRIYEKTNDPDDAIRRLPPAGKKKIFAGISRDALLIAAVLVAIAVFNYLIP